MGKIIIPEAVQAAVDKKPALREQVDRLRPNIEERWERDAVVPYGIGDSAKPRTRQSFRDREDCGWPPENCPPDGQRLCDMQRVSVGVIVTGGSTFNLQIEPTNSAWFEPKAIRATIVDAQNADLNHRILITAVTLNDAPLESTNVTAPVAPALVNNTRFDGWWSDDWQDPDNYAVYVGWPAFSDLNNKNPLRIIGLAFGYNVATVLAATFTIYGNPYKVQPPKAATATARAT